MSLTKELERAYIDILKEELIPAMGCTEPIAISFASSIVKDVLGAYPTSLRVGLSGNIIKNVKSVIVPFTGGMHGINSAVCAGIVSGRYDKKLEVLSCLTPDQVDEIEKYKSSCKMEIYELEDSDPFEILIKGELGKDTAFVHLSKRHTNIEKVRLNGKDITDKYYTPEDVVEKESTDRSLLNVQDIVEFAETVNLDELKPLLDTQISFNMAIAKEGISRDWGASIGRTLYLNSNGETRVLARALSAAGSDARMNGCELPVCIISGSGNQGITASVPICVYGEKLGSSKEEIYRALLISNLITIHQKTGIGCLSAYCGAISAGAGSGCGICYLHGGRFYEIAHTLVNTVAILSGTICDGAKSSCAAKIAMAVEAGIMGYDMAKSGHQFYSGEGIVTKGVENTIENISRLASVGMLGTDKEIIKIMLGKN